MRSIAFGLLLFVFSTRALAQGFAERAERLFREGREAVKAGDYASAYPKFTESQRLEPAPGTLMNLADCEEHLGEIVAARNDFALAASGFSKSDPRRAFVLQHASELEKRIAHVTLRLLDPLPGVVVRRGKSLVGPAELGRAVDVDPGDLEVVVSAPGRIDRRQTLHVAEGQTVDVMLEVGNVVPTKTVIVREKIASTSPWRIAGFVVGGVGAAAAAVGVVTGILTLTRASTVKEHCDAAFVCDAQGYAAAQDGKVLMPVSTTAVIAGVALVATGATLVVWNGGRSKTKIDAWITPWGTGGALSGAF